MKSIDFTTEAKDVAAFTKHFLTQTSLGKRRRMQMITAYLVSKILIFVAIMLVFCYILPPLKLYHVGLISLVILLILWRGASDQIILHQQNKLYKTEAKNPSDSTENIHLTLLNDSYQLEISRGSVTMYYDTIQTIDETDDYLFIFQNDIDAIIVPKGRISGEFDLFRDKLLTHVPASSYTRIKPYG